MAGNMTTEEKPAALPPDLAALQAEAAAFEAEQAPPVAPEAGEGGAPITPVDYAADVRALIDILADGAGVMWPSTKKVLPEAKRQMLAEGWTPVAQQYGFSLVAFLAKYGVWIGAAFATSQIAIPFTEAVQQDRAAAKRAQEVKAAAAGNPAGGPTAATTPAPAPSDLYAKA